MTQVVGGGYYYIISRWFKINLKFMTYEGYKPPGAEKWQAPESEQPEVETKLELGEEIPERERLDLDQITQCKEAYRSSESPVRNNVDAMSPEIRKRMQEERGKFNVNNGILCFVDKGGHPWVTVATDARLESLRKAGFKNGDFFVPFSNGEEPVDYRSPGGIFEPADRLLGLFDGRDRETVKDGTDEEKEEAESRISERHQIAETRRRAEELWRKGDTDQAKIFFDQLKVLKH